MISYLVILLLNYEVYMNYVRCNTCIYTFFLVQQRMLMSNVVAALTPSYWDVWVQVKSCIALHYLHCTRKYIYITTKQLMSLLLCYLNLMLNRTVI